MTEQRQGVVRSEATSPGDAVPATFSNPMQLLLITAFAVFAGEVIVMFLLAVLPHLPMVTEAFVDGMMITVIATPFLYLFLFRPMVLHIAVRRAAEDALLTLNQDLERRVERRTADLAKANELLKEEIDERKKAESELLRTNDFIKRMVESAPCLLLIYDVATMGCSYVNSAVAELLGYTPEQLHRAEGRLFSRILEKQDQENVTRLTRELAAGDDPTVQTELTLKTVKGDPQPCRARLLVFSRSGSGAPTQILLSAVTREGPC